MLADSFLAVCRSNDNAAEGQCAMQHI